MVKRTFVLYMNNAESGCRSYEQNRDTTIHPLDRDDTTTNKNNKTLY